MLLGCLISFGIGSFFVFFYNKRTWKLILSCLKPESEKEGRNGYVCSAFLMSYSIVHSLFSSIFFVLYLLKYSIRASSVEFPELRGKMLSRRRNRICILGTSIAYYCGNLILSIHPKTNPFHTPCFFSLPSIPFSPTFTFHFSSPRKKNFRWNLTLQ